MLTVQRPYAYDAEAVFKRETFTKNGCTLPYRLYIPKNYDCGEMYPLLIFLHGAGERGSDNARHLSAVQTMFDDPASPIYDAIVLAPQCPADHSWVYTPWGNGNYSTETVPESWELGLLLALMDRISASYNIDEDRVYVTGLSMGGFGTWDLLMRHGSRFAAGMPICGGGDPTYAKKLTRIPIRTFHGSDDDAVPVKATRIMYASIVKEGGDKISYTEFDGCGHNVWDKVYGDAENLRWLFSQSREERRKAAEKRAKLKKAAAAAGSGAGLLLSLALVLSGKRKQKRKADKR